MAQTFQRHNPNHDKPIVQGSQRLYMGESNLMIYWLVGQTVFLIIFVIYFIKRNKRLINQQIKKAYLKELSTNIEIAIKYINASLELIDKKSKTCYQLLHRAEGQLKKTQSVGYSPEKILTKDDSYQVSLSITDQQDNQKKEVPENSSTSKKEIPEQTMKQPIAEKPQISSKDESIGLKTFFINFLQIFRKPLANKTDKSLNNELSVISQKITDSTTDQKSLSAENTTIVMEELLSQQLNKCKHRPEELQYWIHLALEKGYQAKQIAQFVDLEIAQIQLMAHLPKLGKGLKKIKNSQ